MGLLNDMGNKSLERRGSRHLGPKIALHGRYHELEMYGHLELHLHSLLGDITIDIFFCYLFLAFGRPNTATERTAPLFRDQCFLTWNFSEALHS